MKYLTNEETLDMLKLLIKNEPNMRVMQFIWNYCLKYYANNEGDEISGFDIYYKSNNNIIRDICKNKNGVILDGEMKMIVDETKSLCKQYKDKWKSKGGNK